MTDVDVPFTCLDRAVYVDGADTLVLADLHLGRGSASDVDAPVDAAADPIGRLESLLSKTSPQTVVVAGDLLHSFSWVPREADRQIAGLVEAVDEVDASLLVTPGNHDAMLDTVFDGETAPAYRLADGETVVCHGHERPSSVVDARAAVHSSLPESGEEPTVTRYVVGHDHPALSVDGRKLPCFLYGPGCEMDRGADSGTRTRAESGIETRADPGSGIETRADLGSGTETRADPRSEIETRADLGSGTETRADLESGTVESDSESGTETRADPKPGTVKSEPKDAHLLVLPAFSELVRGSTVNGMRTADFLCPFVTDAEALHPAIRSPDTDRTLWFPPLGACRNLL